MTINSSVESDQLIVIFEIPKKRGDSMKISSGQTYKFFIHTIFKIFFRLNKTHR